jgi:hypothetical protein
LRQTTGRGVSEPSEIYSVITRSSDALILTYHTYLGITVEPGPIKLVYNSQKSNTETNTYVYESITSTTEIDSNLLGGLGEYVGEVFMSNTYRESLISITIPSGIVSIGTNAFAGCTSLTAVTLWTSVISIGDSIFDSSALPTVTIRNQDGSEYSTIRYAYTRLIRLYNNYATNTKLTIQNVSSSIMPDYQNTINPINSFTTNLRMPHIEDHIMHSYPDISRYIYYYERDGTDVISKALDNYRVNILFVNIPSTVVTINSRQFEKCYSLLSIRIPNSVAIIGDYAFANCNALISVYLSNTVYIVDGVFDYINPLPTVTIRRSPEETLYGTFSTFVQDRLQYLYSDYFTNNKFNYVNETSPYVAEYQKNINPINSFTTNLRIPKIEDHIMHSYPDISRYIYYYERDGTDVISKLSDNYKVNIIFMNIPPTVTDIYVSQFAYCYNLISVNIPNSVVVIGNSAFAGCNALISVYLSNTVYIVEDVFYSIDPLPTVIIRRSPEETLYGAFITNVQDRLKSLYSGYLDNKFNYVNETLPLLAEYYKNINTINTFTTNLRIPEIEDHIMHSYTDISRYIYYYKHYETDVISTALDKYRVNIITVNIPPTVTAINAFQFEYCYNLLFIRIPNSVSRIGTYAFTNCISLITITIPNAEIFVIEANAFVSCTRLKYIRILIQHPNEQLSPKLYNLLTPITPKGATIIPIIKPSPPIITAATYNYNRKQITLQYENGQIDSADIIIYYEYKINNGDWIVLLQNNIIEYVTYKPFIIQLRQCTQYAGYSESSNLFKVWKIVPEPPKKNLLKSRDSSESLWRRKKDQRYRAYMK